MSTFCILIKRKIKKTITHIKRWNIWRKKSHMSPWYKLLVLLKLRTSPTFLMTFTNEELEEFKKELIRSIKNGNCQSTVWEVDPDRMRYVDEYGFYAPGNTFGGIGNE